MLAVPTVLAIVLPEKFALFAQAERFLRQHRC